MRIVDLIVVPAVGGYFVEDLTALQARSIPIPERYQAIPETPGFHAVRQVAQGVSVGLVLEGSSGAREVVWGDCVAVAYSGKAGRSPVFLSSDGLATIRSAVAPQLVGQQVAGFREMAAEVDALTEQVTVTRPLPEPEADDDELSVTGSMSRRDLLTAPARFFRAVQRDLEAADEPTTEQVVVERPLHTAVRYGVSQALLAARALVEKVTMAEVIVQEWGLPLPTEPVPIHAQSGGERYHNADKMIARRVASLPHALVDDIPDQLGVDGTKLTAYVRWLAKRIRDLGGSDYAPTIHLDVHGALGKLFENQLGKILGQLYALDQAANPFKLRIECPVIMESRTAQIETMFKLRDYARFRKLKLQLVADEWANTLEDIRAFVEAGAADMIQVKMPDLGSIHNTVEAVLLCQDNGVGAFLGGSCCETDLSARVSVHVALATRPAILMAKPGMGVDEGTSIVQNEMTRTLAWIQARGG